VNYAGFKTNQAALKSYLDSLSGVTEADYRRWSKHQQLAFLINAYNALSCQAPVEEERITKPCYVACCRPRC